MQISVLEKWAGFTSVATIRNVGERSRRKVADEAINNLLLLEETGASDAFTFHHHE